MNVSVSDNESVKMRPKTSSLYRQFNKPLTSNHQIITPKQRQLRSASQPRQSRVQSSSGQKRRILKKYFNGGSDALSVEMRQAFGIDKAVTDFLGTNKNDKGRIEDQSGDSVQKMTLYLQEKKYNIQDSKKEKQPTTPTLQSQFNFNKQSTSSNFFSEIDDEKCYSFDSTFLQNLQLSDSQVQRMLSDLGIQQGINGVDFEKLVTQNQDYLHHILSNCACFKCLCGKCRCNYAAIKLTYKNGFQTIYGKEFLKIDHTELNRAPTLNQSHYETLSKVPNQGQINAMITTNQVIQQQRIYKQFFHAHPTQQRYKRIPKNQLNTPFMAHTTYQKSFPHWQDYDPFWRIGRPQHNSVVNGSQFYNQTNYSQDFGNSQSKLDPNLSADDVKIKQQHKVYLNVYPDQNETEYKQTFKILEIEPNSLPFQYKSQTQDYNPIQSFDGQYKSITKQSFHKPKILQCPAQKMIQIKKINNKQIQQYLVDKIRALAGQKKNQS